MTNKLFLLITTLCKYVSYTFLCFAQLIMSIKLNQVISSLHVVSYYTGQIIIRPLKYYLIHVVIIV